jgi:DNA-binding PadR family transcriptional regulator
VKGEVLKGHLDLILLAALQPGPAYGYALIRDLREKTGGFLDLTEGTLYPVLHRLEDAGYLKSRTVTVQSRRRRLYSITADGEDQLERLRRDWSEFSRGVENLLRQSGI